MLPSVVATELRESVSEFLRTAFPIATPYFQQRIDGEVGPHALIDDLIEEPGALFKGPYLDIKLPFRVAEASELPFRHIRLPFQPYQHQLLAFQRLCGDAPQSTIVATGTGSGKTECFMLPVLDDCLQRREQGIKTIVVYPMNALATDQARRFAKEVAKLDTRLTVGLFVGGEGDKPDEVMGPDNVITCQRTLRDNPPDILLTNYKMLDFLLIRPKDQPLWRYNTPGMLRYLVVDELHSFDGAQGTDLACLIRRLRDRLEAGTELACVGTSATMGDGDADALLDYASRVFATDFSDHSVIGESRLSPEEYLAAHTPAQDDEGIAFFHWPMVEQRRLDPRQYDDPNEYLFHQARLWFAELGVGDIPQLNASDARRRAEASVALGERLHEHNAFHQLIHDAHGVRDMQVLGEHWKQSLRLPSAEYAVLLLVSLTSLVAAARQWRQPDSDDPDDWCQPFLHLRQQFWLRELRRLVCSVPGGDERAQIRFADDLHDPLKPLHLPLMHCRECHLAAWGAVARRGDNHLNGDLQDFYQAWFGHSSQARLLVPLLDEQDIDDPVQQFCPGCLRLQISRGSDVSCPECQEKSTRRVWVPDISRASQRDGEQQIGCHHDCPDCGARDSMMVMGYKAATLTSVMSGELFATPYNDDHKLIAFSDSVQDAAHRAGFLGANTWRQVVRQAITVWLTEKNVALPLSEVKELLPMYWRDQIGHDGRFCGLFIPPNLEFHRDYEKLRETDRLPPTSELTRMVARRLGWECMAEFGRRAGIGRSLERTGVASVSWSFDALRPIIAAFATQCREELGSLREADDLVFRHFVIGWLFHLRRTGAIHDEALEGYLSNKGREYLLNRVPWMPNYGRSQRPPSAVTIQHLSNNFEPLFSTRRETWSLRWLKKTLGQQAVFVEAESRQVFSLLLKVLTDKGWLVEKESSGQALWLLNPERLLVEAGARQLRCSVCRHRYTINPATEFEYMGLPCLRANCRGLLEPETGRARQARNHPAAAPRRLVPHEHTGLLLREDREAVERSFINGHEPWDINLLSATPTLEMGIDIGELSSVFLCSVPPAQANYLQRIGRAGRRDGNALAVTVANGQNHDLFFYSDPMEMMVGAVQTPGVFLNAIAVLERQLVAYSFDRWALTGIDESAIPGQLRKALDAVEHSRQDQFPYTLIQFVAENRQALLNGFMGMFDNLDAEAREYLERFVSDSGEGSLSWRLVDRMQAMVLERKSLLQKVRQLKTRRDQLLRQPEDEARQEELDELDRERNGFLSLLGGMNRQLTLNFFTDEGLLPNYAFPEEGVILRSAIIRRKADGDIVEGESAYDRLAYDFQRPAQAALSELAPESRFYAVSRELTVDQVDLQLSRAEDWRFCNRCQFTERVDAEDRHSACPRCGSAQWGDSNQKRTVLRLRQVYSTVDDRSSRISDENEQREPVFYNRQMLVDIPEQDSIAGFRLKSESLPFGFEFLRKAAFREVNFGPRGGETNIFSVAGEEMPRQGFSICSHCGKVQKAYYRKNEQPHAYTCKLRKQPELDVPEAYFDSLYLYRELQSEAIRILLPLSEVAYSDEKLHSFIAALNLGLRSYFRGSVQHLEVTDMREPASGNSGERIFLVIYDKIPGGTGYLKELMRTPDNLMHVLELARDVLVSCVCADQPHLDGCYRCILAYRNSRNMQTISRRSAAQLLGDILALKDEIEEVESLSDINTNVLIESKLEQRFVDALAAMPQAHLTRVLINGKKGSLLTLPGADGRPVAWHVEHQVRVGPQDGVLLNTQIDVVLSLARSEEADRHRRIAVYLDGLQYHHDIVDDDVAKRSALLRSGDFWVFSLNWDDLPEAGQRLPTLDLNMMQQPASMQKPMSDLYDQLATRVSATRTAEHRGTMSRGSLEVLAEVLRAPDSVQDELMHRALYRGLTTLVPQAVRDAALRQALAEEVQRRAPETVRKGLAMTDADYAPGGFNAALDNAVGLVSVYTSLPLQVLQKSDLQAVRDALAIHLCFDDGNTELTGDFKASWRAFWHLANQLQFLPRLSLATDRFVSSGAADQVWHRWEGNDESKGASVTAPVSRGGPTSQEWVDVFDLSELPEEQLMQLLDMGLPEPEVGTDLSGSDGEVVLGGDDVELCWQREKVAVVLHAGAELPGWQLVVADELLVDKLQALKTQGAF